MFLIVIFARIAWFNAFILYKFVTSDTDFIEEIKTMLFVIYYC